MTLRGQICFRTVLRGYPRLLNLSEKQRDIAATDKAELSATNERTNERLCTLARWQNIGPGVWGRVGAFVEERFFEGRIGMVNGFADWVVTGDTWWIPEHRGVWRNLPGRPVIRALTLFVPPFSFFFSSAWPKQLLEKLKIYHPMDIKKKPCRLILLFNFLNPWTHLTRIENQLLSIFE